MISKGLAKHFLNVDRKKKSLKRPSEINKKLPLRNPDLDLGDDHPKQEMQFKAPMFKDPHVRKGENTSMNQTPLMAIKQGDGLIIL